MRASRFMERLIVLRIALPLIVLFLLLPANALAQSVNVGGHAVNLEERGAVITSWTLREQGVEGKLSVDSLALPTQTGHETRHFSLVLTVNGEDISPRVNSAPFEIQTDGSITHATAFLEEGLRIEKRFEWPGDDYRGNFVLRITNESDHVVRLDTDEQGPGIRLGPGIGLPNFHYEGLAAELYDFTRPLVALPDDVVEFPALATRSDGEAGLFTTESPRWVGLHNRYRLLAITPSGDKPFAGFAARVPVLEDEPPYLATVTGYWPATSLAPGEQLEYQIGFYAGLKKLDALASGEDTYRAALYSGLWDWMRWLSFGIQELLNLLYGLIGNWGVAIIALAVLVRVILSPIGRAAARQQREWLDKQEVLKPELAEIKAAYKGGEQVERIIELYEVHGVNPYAGLKSLLVVLLQIPVFVALFNILGQAVEFREAGFLWIDSLALPDRAFSLGFELPYFGNQVNFLPVLMGMASLAAMLLSGSEDDGKAHFLMLLGVNAGFFVVFYHFPSGMVLYWTIANLLHVFQLWRVRLSN